MATITIMFNYANSMRDLKQAFRGIGKVENIIISADHATPTLIVWIYKLTIPRMSATRFENVVKRVLTKNLTEQGITPISIEYSE